MDFQKAFDTVPHKRMISKLKSYGIEDPILSWIENYLSDRKQKVIINGKSSEWKDVRAGIELFPFLDIAVTVALRHSFGIVIRDIDCLNIIRSSFVISFRILG
jgi:hypothetical protein